jgi:Ran GTPase-activating protein (RanGAP) involved in mRNA processing and transport
VFFCDAIQALAIFLTHNQIVSLRLQGFDLTPEETALFETVMADCDGLQHIRHITLCDNRLGSQSSEAIDALCRVLLRCILLESLAIWRNSLSDTHIPRLKAFLKSHSSLSRLSLSWFVSLLTFLCVPFPLSLLICCC